MQYGEDGFVYVICDENELWFKIGVSKNVDKRLRALQACCPIQLKVLWKYLCPNAKNVEDVLHARYRDRHIHSEWFLLNSDDHTDLCGTLFEYSLASQRRDGVPNPNNPRWTVKEAEKYRPPPEPIDPWEHHKNHFAPDELLKYSALMS